MKAACEALGISRALYYRWRRARDEPPPPPGSRPKPEPAFSQEERENILDLVLSERFVDESPAAAAKRTT